MNVSFAPLGNRQVDTALELMAGFCTEMGLPFEPFAARRCINELLSHPELGQVWLINGDDGALGYIAMTHGFNFEAGGRDAMVDELYVKPGCRGVGIGTRALRYVESRARASGLRAIYLEARRDDPKALRFYRKLGFQVREQYCLVELGVDS